MVPIDHVPGDDHFVTLAGVAGRALGSASLEASEGTHIFVCDVGDGGLGPKATAPTDDLIGDLLPQFSLTQLP